MEATSCMKQPQRHQADVAGLEKTAFITWGDRAFSIAAPTLWNPLPKHNTKRELYLMGIIASKRLTVSYTVLK